MFARLQLAKNKQHTSKLNSRCLFLNLYLQDLKVVKREITLEKGAVPSIIWKWTEIGLLTAKPPGVGSQLWFLLPRLTCQPRFCSACSKTSWEKPTWKMQGGWVGELSSMKTDVWISVLYSLLWTFAKWLRIRLIFWVTEVHLKTGGILWLDFCLLHISF